MALKFIKRIFNATGRGALSVADRLLDTCYHSRRPMNKSTIKQAAELLADNPNVLVCAGSGLSAESGVPTFRGPDGIFRDTDIAKLTHVETFESDLKDRKEMMQWYQDRRNDLDAISPNPGHLALIKLAKTGNYTFATQNVDHLLEAASAQVGYRPPIHHLHGALLEVRCHDCRHTVEDLDLDLGQLPTCERCGGPLRPGVVWFGESLPEDALAESTEAAQKADVCLIVGTSGLVYPAAALPETARRYGATLVEINPNPSALSDVSQILIRDKAGQALPRLYEEVARLRDER